MYAPNARRSLVIHAVFERFTESSIRAVMLSQQEAKLFHSPQARSSRRRSKCFLSTPLPA